MLLQVFPETRLSGLMAWRIALPGLILPVTAAAVSVRCVSAAIGGYFKRSISFGKRPAKLLIGDETIINMDVFYPIHEDYLRKQFCLGHLENIMSLKSLFLITGSGPLLGGILRLRHPGPWKR